jgi:hypothetical protein
VATLVIRTTSARSALLIALSVKEGQISVHNARTLMLSSTLKLGVVFRLVLMANFLIWPQCSALIAKALAILVKTSHTVYLAIPNSSGMMDIATITVLSIPLLVEATKGLASSALVIASNVIRQ